MYLAPCALKDDAEHTGLNTELFQNLAVLTFERRAVEGQERLPAKFGRNDWSLVVGRLGKLVGHLEEEQERHLLNVLKAGESGVLQHARIGRCLAFGL